MSVLKYKNIVFSSICCSEMQKELRLFSRLTCWSVTKAKQSIAPLGLARFY